jgi:hypothetical protein
MLLHSEGGCVMINSIYQLNWATGYPDISLNIISGCVCGVFSDETGIYVGGLTKVDSSPSMGGTIQLI